MTGTGDNPTRTSWMRLARTLALVFMLLCVFAFIAGLFAYQDYASDHPEDFTIWNWTIEETETVFNRVGLSLLWWIQWNLISAILFAVVICGIGFFIFIRIKDDWFALYLSVAFVLFGTFSGYPISALERIYPALMPILDPLGVIAWVSLFIIFYLFPDGRFVPRWVQWAAALLVLMFGLDIVIYKGDTPPAPMALVMVIAIAAAPLSQIHRYRKVSNAVERQQTKWVIFGLLVISGTILIGISGLVIPSLSDPNSTLALVFAFVGSSTTLVMGILPVTIAFAILRYRLWDIDVIIRRTLVYGALTITLALLYFGSVILLQSLVAAGGGRQSTIVTVISTLFIAALFTPLRRRIQNDIDRRFYRKKYDAEKTVASFGAGLRQEVDLNDITTRLLAVVEDTVQPENVSLWLRKARK
jgi:hypothetical protein